MEHNKEKWELIAKEPGGGQRNEKLLRGRNILYLMVIFFMYTDMFLHKKWRPKEVDRPESFSAISAKSNASWRHE